MSEKILLLFDVDGTLTHPRLTIQKNMTDFLYRWKSCKNITLGIVGGSDIEKQKEQLQDILFSCFHYIFSENGLVSFENEEFTENLKLIHQMNFVNFLGEEMYQEIINTVLNFLSKISLPVKRGTFIELRHGMINVSPIGRSCNQKERDAFFEYDKKHNIREKMKRFLEEKWKDKNLAVSIGGQISLDIYPKGWDKTYCLQFVENKYDKIYFFGDRTEKNGNDYELYHDKRVIGIKVENPDDTIKKVEEIVCNFF